eukprot:1047734-Pyramimonas_sp.AAC.2
MAADSGHGALRGTGPSTRTTSTAAPSLTLPASSGPSTRRYACRHAFISVSVCPEASPRAIAHQADVVCRMSYSFGAVATLLCCGVAASPRNEAPLHLMVKT